MKMLGQDYKETTHKPVHSTLLFSVMLAVAVLFSSCNSALQNIGQTAVKDQQIIIQDTLPKMALWQTNDLAIQYTLVDHGDSFTISGFVLVDDSIINTFPVAQFLNIYVYLLNEAGVATSRHVIRPSMQAYSTFPEKSRFERRLPKDGDSVSIAFSYWGNFREKGITSRRDVMEWGIFYNPFKK